MWTFPFATLSEVALTTTLATLHDKDIEDPVDQKVPKSETSPDEFFAPHSWRFPFFFFFLQVSGNAYQTQDSHSDNLMFYCSAVATLKGQISHAGLCVQYCLQIFA